MKIEWGQTRIVLVFSLFVIKFPRVRFICALRVLIDYMRGENIGTAGDKYEDNLLMLILVYLFTGLTANRREFAY